MSELVSKDMPGQDDVISPKEVGEDCNLQDDSGGQTYQGVSEGAKLELTCTNVHDVNPEEIQPGVKMEVIQESGTNQENVLIIDDVVGGDDGTLSERSDKEMEHDDKGLPNVRSMPDIEDLVNKALEKKLGGFQAQMQQMLLAFQNSSGSSMNRGQTSEGDYDMEDGEQKADLTPKPEVLDEKVIKWRQFLGKVSSVLGMEPEPGENTMSNEGGDEKRQVKILPPDDVLKKLWGRDNDGIISEHNVFDDQRYCWSSEDLNTYSKIAQINPDLSGYIRQLHGISKKRGYLPEAQAKLNQENKKMEASLRHQQKIISYTSYFLAALNKSAKGQEGFGNELVDEIIENIGHCLSEMCALSVQATVHSVRARRRIHLEAMNIKDNHLSNQLVNMPFSKLLFQKNIKEICMKHGTGIQGRYMDRPRSTGAYANWQFDERVPPPQAGMGKSQGNRRKGRNKPTAGKNKKGPSGQTKPAGWNQVGGAQSSAGQNQKEGAQKQDGSESEVGRSNANMGSQHIDGPQPSVGGLEGRNEVGQCPGKDPIGPNTSGKKRRLGKAARNRKRRKGNNLDFSEDQPFSERGFQNQAYSDKTVERMGYSGMPSSSNYSNLMNDNGGSLLSSYTGTANRGRNIDDGKQKFYQSSQYGDDYYRPGDPSTYVGYMSFPGSTPPDDQSHFHSDDVY